MIPPKALGASAIPTPDRPVYNWRGQLIIAGVLAVWTNLASAACNDLPAPGVDYSGCTLAADLDGVDDAVLSGLDLRNADLSGARIPNRLDGMDLRGANIEGAEFRQSNGDIGNDSLSFEIEDSRFHDTQMLFEIREEPPTSGEYRVGMFLKGVGLISPFDANAYGPAGNSGQVSVERPRDSASGALIAGDIAPIRYAVSIYRPWASLGVNGNDSFGFQARQYSAAVSASSNGGPAGSAHYVVDGIASDAGWQSSAEDSPWWQIDLGASFRLEEIVLHARSDAAGLDALRDAVVMVSDYPFPSEPLNPQNFDSIGRYTALQAPQVENRIPLNRSVRYLRIQKPAAQGQMLGFKTVELNGYLADDADQPFTPDFPPAPSSSPDLNAEVPNECLGSLFDATQVRSCNLPTPAQVQDREYLLNNPELDFSYCDLTGQVLANYPFEGFNLDGADLSGVDLRGANFAQADLRGANLRGANLSAANLAYALIAGADFRGAVLDDVEFGSVMSNSCALFSNQLPQSVNPEINDHPGLPRPQAIAEATNISYGYARQSSTDNNGVPPLAIDSDLASYSQTALEASPWWELDLGAVYNAAAVELQVDLSQEADLADAVLLISDWPIPDDPLNRIDGEGLVAYALQPVVGDAQRFSAQINRTMRYLRIQKPDSGSLRRLSLSNVKVNASAFATAPSTTVPLTDGQRNQLGASAELKDLLSGAKSELEADGTGSLKSELGALSQEARALRSKLETYKDNLQVALNLRKSVSYAEKTLKLLKLYRPLRNSPQIKKLEKVVKQAKQASSVIVQRYLVLESLAFPGRLSLRQIERAAGSASSQIYSSLRYLNIGADYLELNLRCALYDPAGTSLIPQLNAKVADDIPLMQEYIGKLASNQDPHQRIARHRTAIQATDDLLVPVDTSIQQIDQAVRALGTAFSSVFTPISAIGEALATEIDLGVVKLSAAEVIEAVEKAVSYIPGLAEAEAAVQALIDPLLQPLLNAIDVLPELGLPEVPGLDGLAELVTSFDPSIHVPDPFNYDLPPLEADFDDLANVVCNGVPTPKLWPRDDEDLDGDGLSNGIELKRVMPDPYPQKLQTLANSADTDLDGLGDGFEVTLAQFVPTSANNQDEVNADFDSDGLSNLEEFLNGTNPQLADSDGDGLGDALELAAGLNPNLADSDGNGTNDDAEDSDGDGMINQVEAALALNLADAEDADHDQDEDGVSNLVELARGTALNNAPPLAVDDLVNLRPGDSVEIDLLANDSATDGDTIELLEAQIDFPDTGMWSIDNGIVRFETGSDFDSLASGESETLAFLYRVRDPGGSSSAMVKVTVSNGSTQGNSSNSKGGSIGFAWLLLLMLLWFGRVLLPHMPASREI